MSTTRAAGVRSLPWIILSTLPGLALAAYYELEARAVTAPGFPLDDAWIHAQFARNLATGHGFSYTGDQWVAGSTAPAWTPLLAQQSCEPKVPHRALSVELHPRLFDDLLPGRNVGCQKRAELCRRMR